MDQPPTLPKKRDVLEALLSDSNVYLHLDPRRDGVIVPKWFQNQPELILQVGLNMPVPILDLEVDDNGVSCTLSFNRSPFWCSLPWGAVFAVVSDRDRRGVVWPEDVPPDGQSAKSFRPPPPKPARPKLTALGPNDRLEPEAPAEEESAEEAAPRELGPNAKCGSCGTKWIDDQSSCPVCGASIREAVDGSAAPTPTVSSVGVAAPPADSAAEEAKPAAPPVLTKKKGGRAAPAGAAAEKRSRRKGDGAPSKPVLASVPDRVDTSDIPGAAESARDNDDKSAVTPLRPKPGSTPLGVPAPSAKPLSSIPLTKPKTPAKPSKDAPSGGEAKKVKRELPPYLRVVK